MEADPSAADFKKWLRRAKTFVNRLRNSTGGIYIKVYEEPPLRDEQLRRLLGKRLYKSMPEFHRMVYTTIHSAIEYVYSWEPLPGNAAARWCDKELYGSQISGGVKVLPAKDLRASLELAEVWRENWEELGEFQAAKFWENSFPLLWIDSGDYVGINADGSLAPKTVYLSHDCEDDCLVLSDSLGSFLNDFETACYLCPGDMLGLFGGKRGMFSRGKKRLATLRDLFER